MYVTTRRHFLLPPLTSTLAILSGANTFSRNSGITSSTLERLKAAIGFCPRFLMSSNGSGHVKQLHNYGVCEYARYSSCSGLLIGGNYGRSQRVRSGLDPD